MVWLMAGLLLWMGTHFIPTLAVNLKQRMVGLLGEWGYKGVFSLLILSALLLIVCGWRAMGIEHWYYPAPLLRHLAMLIMLVAFILLVSAKSQSRIRQYIRHPQLTSIVLWSLAHLLANGETRSVILFGTFGFWAVCEMLLINRRDGAWVKPPEGSWASEVQVLVIAVVLMLVVMSLHGWFTGVPLF